MAMTKGTKTSRPLIRSTTMTRKEMRSRGTMTKWIDCDRAVNDRVVAREFMEIEVGDDPGDLGDDGKLESGSCKATLTLASKDFSAALNFNLATVAKDSLRRAAAAAALCCNSTPPPGLAIFNG
jgi:hypothetical protein